MKITGARGACRQNALTSHQLDCGASAERILKTWLSFVTSIYYSMHEDNCDSVNSIRQLDSSIRGSSYASSVIYKLQAAAL